MGKYPNVNRTWEIIYIDKQKMRLSDESKWQFLPTMPPPSLWKARDGNVAGDTVKPEERSFKSNNLYAIIGISKKGTDTQAMYLGGAKGEASDINVTKSMTDTEYPENHLGKEWKIRKVAGKLIILEDDSVWQLTGLLSFLENPRAADNWQPEEHYVIIRRAGGKSGSVSKAHEIQNYEVKNLKTGVALVGIFKGWER